jgi:hypothetical protein
MPNVKVGNYFGGLDIKKQRQELKDNTPAIVVGTPGRIKQLATEKALNLSTVRHFVVDECDKVLEKLDMRGDVQEIFKKTPHEKQVMMFSATLSQDVRPVCKKFMSNVSGCTRWHAGVLAGSARCGRAVWQSSSSSSRCSTAACVQLHTACGRAGGVQTPPAAATVVPAT